MVRARIGSRRIAGIIRWKEIPSMPPLSELVGAMDRDDATGQVADFDVAKASLEHHALQGFLVRMLADRFRQVLVTVGVTGEKLAQARQDLERMHVVELREHRALH